MPPTPAALELRDRARIEAFLRRDPALHLYALGDLDPFFWPATRWFGLPDDSGALEALALLYQGPGDATLLALERHRPAALAELLRRLQTIPSSPQSVSLPARLYAHLSPGLAAALAPRFRAGPAKQSLKLVLAHPDRLGAAEEGAPATLRALSPADQTAVEAFYAEAYPGNWFDRRMLETGQYLGLWQDGALVGAAGVHVYSPETRVAALGNIATHPRARRRGLARQVTAQLCRQLLETVDTVGLNVYADNAPAIAMYAGLGFERTAAYEELTLVADGPA